ncbi:hypothetical protein C5688_13760 [Methylocystis sp. MitZ-2018]|nr:hypothetical protein C5688_13760 [Methylocystis sp. MitZ-2018]
MVAVKKKPGTPNGEIQFFAPPGTLLLEGVEIKVDETEFSKLPFFRCTQISRLPVLLRARSATT